MVRRLDPWFVLIDCEKQREEMSVPIKIKSYFYLEVFFLSPTLISNSQLFFFLLHSVFNNQISSVFSQITSWTFISTPTAA